jgi:hypothetical protein
MTQADEAVKLGAPLRRARGSFRRGEKLTQPRSKPTGIATLNVHDSWPSEATDEAFSGGKACKPSGGGSFHIIGSGRRPGDEVAVIDDVFLIGLKSDGVDSAETV